MKAVTRWPRHAVFWRGGGTGLSRIPSGATRLHSVYQTPARAGRGRREIVRKALESRCIGRSNIARDVSGREECAGHPLYDRWAGSLDV